MKPPGESAQGFVPDSSRREDIFLQKEKKRESETERKRVIVLRKRYGISPDINRASAQKVAHYRRGTSRTDSRYNMNSRVIDGGISYTW